MSKSKIALLHVVHLILLFPCRDVSGLIIGTAQDVTFTVVVKNTGEDAFISVLEIEEPAELYYVQVKKLSSVSFRLR